MKAQQTPAEREATLTQIIDDQRRRIIELESELDSWQRIASGGVNQLIDARKDDALRIAELTSALHETAPEIVRPARRVNDDELKALAAANNWTYLKWGDACTVGARVWLRYGAESHQIDVFELDQGTFPGSRAEAQNEILEPIAALIQRMVMPSDVRIYTLDGLTPRELMDIANRLRFYPAESDEFNAQRLKEFDQVWEKMEQTGRWKTRRIAHKRFKESIDSILENANKRRSKTGWVENTSTRIYRP